LKDIPKESSPTIDLGFILINTLYIGASPNDIDELITSEIEEVIDGVE
jgi:multidrug efflux pump subunit AcrB